MVPYEAFLSAKPVVTTRRCRRPARGRARPRDRARRRSRRSGARRRLRVPRRARRRGEGVGSRGPGGRRARHVGRLRRRAPRVTPTDAGRLLLAAAAVALRDRRLLDAAPAGAARARRRRRRASRASARRPQTSRSTTSATTRTRTAGSSTRSGKRPGVVVLHEYVLHHLIAGITIGRGNGRGYLDAMERELGVAGRLLGLGVLDNLLPLLWETQPERFPLAGVVLDHAHGRDRPLRLRRAERARPPATRAGSGASRIPVWPPEPVVAGERRRRAIR